MNTTHPAMTLYGLKVSYFTGKMENYLRYKEIPFSYRSMTADHFERIIPEATGARQMPAIQLADGRWMTDSTPMIEWLETQWPRHSIYPDDPLQDFVCRLIEDYADEWLWRPAMHYRWSFAAGRAMLGHLIVDEMASTSPLPRVLIRWSVRRRQKKYFVDGDGVTEQTRAHVEQGYLRLLDILERVFTQRPFVFGERPTLADFGLSGPLFRHFANDPDPAMIMRERAPAVYAWTARLWRTRGSACGTGLVTGIPDDLLPLLAEIGATHLPNLVANAAAHAEQQRHYSVALQGTSYTRLPVSQYRVWCLERLQHHARALPAEVAALARPLLEAQQCWQPLWQEAAVSSGYDPDQRAPFGRGLPVYHVPGP